MKAVSGTMTMLLITADRPNAFTTLKNLPASTQLPWHRVVNSQGRISLPANQPGHLVQKERLAQEGVIFVHGKINLKQFLWQL